MKNIICFTIVLMFSLTNFGCYSVKSTQVKEERKVAFDWKGANVYFMLTDRFENGNKSNDVTLNRTEKVGKLRGFEGGDLRGVINKIESNYFTDLGINAIWMTPLVEQIHAATDEGWGKTYGYHGYWAKDWTNIDPNFGTKADLKELVEKAHAKGIRIVLDAVINHTGPVTDQDPAWPENWVRVDPTCNYDSYDSTVNCTLVDNLPDIKTNSIENVELPKFLVEKWKQEGRYEQEMASLDKFFEKTGFPRAPKYYIMKWLSDYITEYGIDGYRIDTVKHTEPDVWMDFIQICQDTFDDYNSKHPDKFMGSKEFFVVGEVYGYGISQKLQYHFPDTKVNYYSHGFPALINFDFISDANQDFEKIFSKYDQILHNEMEGNTVMNYLASHDDAHPFDVDREKNYEAATKLLLAPGISQLYYGDESARPLKLEGVDGDVHLRSFMNWEDLKNNPSTISLLQHYQKLGKFRANHPAVGAGIHKVISKSPYWFSRSYKKDNIEDVVVVGLDLKTGDKSLKLNKIFPENTRLRDAYSGVITTVKNDYVRFNTDYSIVLLEEL